MAYHAIVDWTPYFMEIVLGFAQGQAGFMMIEILLVGMLALIVFGGLGDAIGRHGSFVLSALIGFLGTISLDLFVPAGFGANNAPPATFIIPLRHGSNAPYGVWSSELLPTKMRATATSLTLSLLGGLPLGGVIVRYLVGTVGRQWHADGCNRLCAHDDTATEAA